MLLTEARTRLEELLREVTRRPEVATALGEELERVFSVLRNYAYFADFQRRELEELCQEMERL